MGWSRIDCRAADGGITLCHALTEHGGVIAEWTVTRLAPDCFLWHQRRLPNYVTWISFDRPHRLGKTFTSKT